jgi:hypothetical protein
MRSLLTATLIGLIGAVAGCANDPVYMECPPDSVQTPACKSTLEAGMDDGMGGVTGEDRSSLMLPVKPETVDDAAARGMRAAALGIDVPYVKVGDIEVEVEWTITNLTDKDATASIELNGATEYFVYDPSLIMLSNDDEAPPTPGLDGDVPMHIAPNAVLTGLFREDQIREASIDIEQITRANVNPFAATLTINKNDLQIQPMTAYDPMMPDVAAVPDLSKPAIPREAFAQMIRVDLVFKPSAHMTLEYTVRVRDVRGIMADKLMAAPAADLTVFAPADFALMAAPGA